MSEKQIVPVAQQKGNSPSGINFFDPATIEPLTRFSTMFANSSLVPESYRIGGVVGGKTGEGPKKTVSEAEATANCVIAFDVATRIGASPLMVMQNLYIVHGRPSWSSKFLIATINTCGRFEPLKFEMTSNGVCNNGVANVKCVAWTTPKGVTHDENGKPVTSKSPLSLRGTAVTIQMAIDEGWYNKNGSKWRTMPEQMLRYRAASFWCSTYSPELSMGMRTVEENVEEADYIDVTEQVEEEISAWANKGTISFDDSPAQDPDEVPANVDPDTGEIKEETKETSASGQTSTEDDGPGY